MTELTPEQSDRIEAAAFRRLLSHLDARKDVQNIDLMILADFCRNCLSDWYREAAENEGIVLSKAEARERIYGMSYEVWKDEFQKPASDEQLKSIAARKSRR